MYCFKNLHPFTLLIYSIIALFYCAVFFHPLAVAISLISSILICLKLCPQSVSKIKKHLLIMCRLIIIINPFLNSRGKTVILTIFHINITLEAIIWGVLMAGLAMGSICRFISINVCLTVDKFVYLLGNNFPKLSVIFSLTANMIPFLQNKASDISYMNKNLNQTDDKFTQMRVNLNSLLNYSLERSVNISKSMESRGFATAKPTKYKKYNFTFCDKFIIVFSTLVLILTDLTIYPVFNNVGIIPEISIEQVPASCYPFLALYIIFMFLPLILDIFEEIKWKYLISKI